MKKRYILIDSENIQNRLFEIIQNSRKRDKIIIFYTLNHSGRLDEYLNTGKQKTNIEFVKCISGNNALDLQLLGVLSYLIQKHPDREFLIYSNDKGYKPAIKHWQGKNVDVEQVSFLTPLSETDIFSFRSVITAGLFEKAKPLKKKLIDGKIPGRHKRRSTMRSDTLIPAEAERSASQEVRSGIRSNQRQLRSEIIKNEQKSAEKQNDPASADNNRQPMQKPADSSAARNTHQPEKLHTSQIQSKAVVTDAVLRRSRHENSSPSDTQIQLSKADKTVLRPEKPVITDAILHHNKSHATAQQKHLQDKTAQNSAIDSTIISDSLSESDISSAGSVRTLIKSDVSKKVPTVAEKDNNGETENIVPAPAPSDMSVNAGQTIQPSPIISDEDKQSAISQKKRGRRKKCADNPSATPPAENTAQTQEDNAEKSSSRRERRKKTAFRPTPETEINAVAGDELFNYDDYITSICRSVRATDLPMIIRLLTLGYGNDGAKEPYARFKNDEDFRNKMANLYLEDKNLRLLNLFRTVLCCNKLDISSAEIICDILQSSDSSNLQSVYHNFIKNMPGNVSERQQIYKTVKPYLPITENI